ncbi:hypothetical protein WJX84_005745 [Apatococcus fuscideae]|uniref:GPN-loop GTPase 2 n=1 Tax=Apatococcus fuscideae TaxID=2026836 RepID=A0AAW1T1L0_9CHLO
MPFGQWIVGPPGSGKTTYCNGLQQYLTLSGRKCAIINLDPANDALPYTCAVNISNLVTLEEVQTHHKLGPNGGLIFCMEFLQENLDWLKEQLDPLLKDGTYLIFDCPGQVELFTLHDSMKVIAEMLTNQWHVRLAVVHLVDAHLCTDASKYMSALLLSLSSMLHLEMPHVNVLSKMDMIQSYGPLAFNLDFYTEVQDLSYLVKSMEGTLFAKRFQKLTEGLCEVVEDFGLISFTPLMVEDKESMKQVLALVDKATGYVWGGNSEQQPYSQFQYTFETATGGRSDLLSEHQERYVDHHEKSSRDLSFEKSLWPPVAFSSSMNRVDVELSLSSDTPDLRVTDALDLSFEGQTTLCICRRTRQVVGRIANEQLENLQQSPSGASIRTLKKSGDTISHAVVRVVCQLQQTPSTGIDLDLQSILRDSRLQQTIRKIDTASKPEAALSTAMQNPEFERFCNQLLGLMQVQAFGGAW